jgi:transcriptional regulator with XRE-family HTH domain
MSEEVMTPETVHRSPHTFEIVEPTKGVDRRKLEENVQKRMDGRKQHTNCGAEQLLTNNDLIDHPVMEAAESDPLRLFASESNPPNFAIIHEKPEHRLIVYLKARGMSNREVAERVGYSEAWISQICRQPWFRIRIVQELREAGMDKVAKLLEGAAVDSIYTLLEIRDDGAAPKAVRRACADSLLDRWLGKPTVHVAHDNDRIPSSPEIAAVDTELQQIEQQLKETPNGSEVQNQ